MKKAINKLAKFWTGVIVLFPAYLGKSQTLSVDSILHIVEVSNPEFKVYDARINAYNEYAKGAKALEPPKVGAGFFMTPYNVSMWKNDATNNTSGMGLFVISGQQMITNAKKLNANANYMQSMAAVDSSMKKSMRNEIFMMVKMNYYDWVIKKKKWLVLNESESLISYLIKSTELKYTYGMDKLNAYYKAKALLAELQTLKLLIEQETRQKMSFLNTLMNRDKTIVFDIDTSYSIKNYEAGAVDSSYIAQKRSDFSVLTKQMNLLRAKQKFESSKKYPDYGVNFDHMIPFGTSPQQFSLTFMVSIPIAPWSSKMYSANVKGLEFEIYSLREKQSAFINQVSGNLNDLKIQMRSKKQQLKLTNEVLVPSMKKNYETELLAYEQNTEMLFMVLDAWQNLKLANLTYLDQLMELLTLQVQYEKETEVIK